MIKYMSLSLSEADETVCCYGADGENCGTTLRFLYFVISDVYPYRIVYLLLVYNRDYLNIECDDRLWLS